MKKQDLLGIRKICLYFREMLTIDAVEKCLTMYYIFKLENHHTSAQKIFMSCLEYEFPRTTERSKKTASLLVKNEKGEVSIPYSIPPHSTPPSK